jgi:hypothetical protein
MDQCEKILIIGKTYPMPSSNYREHTCVVGVNEEGEIRRLFPVPFRLLDKDKQFKRWQWIEANISKASDRRPESYRINTDTIKLFGIMDTKNQWHDRLSKINPFIFKNCNELYESGLSNTHTLGIVKPLSFRLEIEEMKADEKEWTKSEITYLTGEGLFDSGAIRNRSVLRKLPYKFYYSFETNEEGKITSHRHLITDWEVGMLFWNCYDHNKNNWENKFRQKLEKEFQKSKDLHLLMGSHHRFKENWLIVGLIYPPKSNQLFLFPPN